MRLIERRTLISYQWWRPDGGAINPAHVQMLEEDAEERIAVMRGDGFTEGELHSACGPEEIPYTGYWVARVNHD